MLEEIELEAPKVGQGRAMDTQTPFSSRRPKPKRTRLIFVLSGVVVLILSALAFSFKYSQTAKKVDDKATPITVSTATIENVPLSIRTIGNVLSYSVVNVVPQVGGQLKKVYFTQGQYVKKGDLLFLIDPSPYQAALEQGEGNVAKDKAQIEQAQAMTEKDMAQVGSLKANLARDQAQSKYASVEMSRYNLLQTEGAVSREQSDQTYTNAATASATEQSDTEAIKNGEATVRADRAAIQTAKGTLAADTATAQTARIQLGWTQIRSPLDGRTGSLNVYEGNIVTANTNTPLVTIDQVQPIYVTFTVPEQYLDEIRQNLASNTLKVEALIEGIKKDAVQGAVSFLENTVNTTTGTVVLRAAFANKEMHLFPGQFVDVIVTMPPQGKTVVVPTKALQTTQQGTAVYVVKGDNTVVLNPVEVARTHGELAALTSGVQAGDVVVTDGQLQLTPGSKVQIVPDSK